MIRFFKVITSKYTIKLPSPLKQNERVLSSKALNVGRSLVVNSNMEKFTFNSDVRGYHVCKEAWKPAIGEILHAEQELDNAVNKFAVKVVKNNETVGHLLCEYSQILSSLIARGGKNCKQLCREMGGFLVGWCSVVRLK